MENADLKRDSQWDPVFVSINMMEIVYSSSVQMQIVIVRSDFSGPTRFFPRLLRQTAIAISPLTLLHEQANESAVGLGIQVHK